MIPQLRQEQHEKRASQHATHGETGLIALTISNFHTVSPPQIVISQLFLEPTLPSLISIGKLTNAESVVKYLQQAISESTTDYYSLRGESPGQWDGQGAQLLSLTGQVTPDQLRSLLNGLHPTTGQSLAKKWHSQRIVAFDVTFSAPKSVSLLYAIGNEQTRKAVLEAHDQAVDAVITYLQKHAAFARQYNIDTHEVEPVSAHLVLPRFIHRTARPVTDPHTGKTTIDPQLHTHIPIPTWVCRPDGTWSALLSEPLYMHAAAAGAVGQAVMRKHLVEKLGVEVEVMPNGTFEIAGINEAMRREFSKRRQQIEVAEAMFGINTIAGREKANLATREKKPEVQAGPELVLDWKERAHKVGLTQKLITHLLHRHEPRRVFELSDESIAALVGEHGLTQEVATFSRREVVRKITTLAPDGMTLQQCGWAVDQVLSSGHAVALGTQTHLPDSLRPSGLSRREASLTSLAPPVTRGTGFGSIATADCVRNPVVSDSAVGPVDNRDGQWNWSDRRGTEPEPLGKLVENYRAHLIGTQMSAGPLANAMQPGTRTPSPQPDGQKSSQTVPTPREPAIDGHAVQLPTDGAERGVGENPGRLSPTASRERGGENPGGLSRASTESMAAEAWLSHPEAATSMEKEGMRERETMGFPSDRAGGNREVSPAVGHSPWQNPDHEDPAHPISEALRPGIDHSWDLPGLLWHEHDAASGSRQHPDGDLLPNRVHNGDQLRARGHSTDRRSDRDRDGSLLADSRAEIASERDESRRILLTEPRYSTPEMVQVERQMLAISLARRNTGVAQIPQSAVNEALVAHPTLTPEQQNMIRQICLSGDGVQIVEGVAGAGKTYALNVVREITQSQNHQVVGLALAGRAAQTLQEEAAINSHTLARALPYLEQEHLAPGTVVIVDEAGMVGSRQLAKLVELTARDNAKLVLCGDSHQLQPIDAGAPFRALGEQLGKIELRESIRHKEAWEKEALLALREGAVDAAVDAYIEKERVVVAESVMERRRMVVMEAMAASRAGEDVVVLTQTRNEAMAINELTRAVLIADGYLHGPGIEIDGRSFLVGDRIICTKNDQRLGLTNGLRAEVVDVSGEQLTLLTKNGDVVIDASGYEHLDYGYALTAHKAQGITVDVALVVGSESASREWAYSVMSRARGETRYFTIAKPPTLELDAINQTKDELTLSQQLDRSWSLVEAKESTLDFGRPSGP